MHAVLLCADMPCNARMAKVCCAAHAAWMGARALSVVQCRGCARLLAWVRCPCCIEAYMPTCQRQSLTHCGTRVYRTQGATLPRCTHAYFVCCPAAVKCSSLCCPSRFAILLEPVSGLWSRLRMSDCESTPLAPEDQHVNVLDKAYQSGSKSAAGAELRAQLVPKLHVPVACVAGSTATAAASRHDVRVCAMSWWGPWVSLLCWGLPNNCACEVCFM
jgi:hypothetical protein